MSGKDNEFEMEFDFEKEYGISSEDLFSEGNADTEDMADMDLKSILDSDFDDASLLNPEYEGGFDYGPDDFQEEPEPPVIERVHEEVPQEDPPAEDVPPELDSAEQPEVPEEQHGKKPRREKNEPAENGRKKPMSKMRRFKNELLPNIILAVAAILILVFVIGSVSRAVKAKKADKDAQLNASQASESAQSQEKIEAERVLKEAAALADSYDFDAAIEKLNSFTGDVTKYPEISNQISAYAQINSTMVDHNDPGAIANLSFHVLIADPARAFSDSKLGGKYNQNFVTTDEFEKILQALYDNDYVLVNMSNFIAETETGGTTTYSSKTLKLPDGKKPIMITETMVNYFTYMIDSDNDGEADKGGAGFASKLVVDSNGDIKAEMVDSSGNTLVGNYDLVPILEDFIAKHPDFSYQGARATLAITGDEGIFGYRTQGATVQKKGQDYYDQQVKGAKEVVQALQDKGYTIACYTYANTDYGKLTSTEIQAEMDLWKREVVPIVGQVNTIVFARASDISSTGAYTGSRFNVLYNEGFRYFIGNGSKPSADVVSNYVRQVRLMVTGSGLANASTMFSDYFDAKSLLNTQRGNVPQ